MTTTDAREAATVDDKQVEEIRERRLAVDALLAGFQTRFPSNADARYFISKARRLMEDQERLLAASQRQECEARAEGAVLLDAIENFSDPYGKQTCVWDERGQRYCSVCNHSWYPDDVLVGDNPHDAGCPIGIADDKAKRMKLAAAFLAEHERLKARQIPEGCVAVCEECHRTEDDWPSAKHNNGRCNAYEHIEQGVICPLRGGK